VKWRRETKKIKDIHEYPKNARSLNQHDAAHLQESLSKFGQCEPLVVNTDGTLIGGHQRIRTLKKMGYKEVDVFVPDVPLSEKEVEELNIRLNRNVGNFDYDVLANMWDPADLLEYGFTPEELQIEEIDSKSGPGEGTKESDMSSMTIWFADAMHLQEAEAKIAPIVEGFGGAKYKVKVK